MTFDIPNNDSSIIKVIGVGGGGGNAVSYMFTQGIKGVDFAICNTDAQAMENSPIPVKISLGPHLTEGRGAGSIPNVGKEACIESIDEVRAFLSENTKMLFVTAGMGGGTGTGAAPIIAKAAKDMGILTVAIVTMPFKFEGKRRNNQADEGLKRLKESVDAIIVISNNKLKEIFSDMSMSNAFVQADNVLLTAAKGIAEIITLHGTINVDFADVNTVMKGSGVAIMGSGIAEGEDRAENAIKNAINSPLLEDNDIRGAKHILLNITSGTTELTMGEMGIITDYIEEEAGEGTDVIWGTGVDESLGDKVSVTLIATGFQEARQRAAAVKRLPNIATVPLDDDIIDITTGSEIIDLDQRTSQNVIDFDEVEVQKTVRKLQTTAYRADTDPYVKSGNSSVVEQRTQPQPRPTRTTKPMDNPQTLSDMENIPAYMRKNIELDDVNELKAPSTRTHETVSFDETNEIQIKKNSFFHDNVD